MQKPLTFSATTTENIKGFYSTIARRARGETKILVAVAGYAASRNRR
jgi:hypothetical protein